MQGDAKEEVRSRLDLEAVIGEYVQLKRAGRNWKGLSPFSEEKTPSFFVSPDKGIWHDFSSNQGGDLYSFIMRVEGMDFRQALEHLARKAGVELSDYEQHSGASAGLSKRKKRLSEMNELATVFYQRQLLQTQTAIDYVKRRGLNKQVVHDFRVGYSPAGGRVLVQYLTQKGYSASEMRGAGLVGSRGGDMFRERLMIPLMDPQGGVVGFTGRILSDRKDAPKYLNTPQTLLYDKGRHVFGLHLAKESIRKADVAVVVEGNMDVISSHQFEVAQTVATAGTALTSSHLKALSRFSERIALAFDGDKAGIAATERAIPIAQEVDVQLSIIRLPDDFKDPDELMQHDADMWRTAIKQAIPAIEWLMLQYETQMDVTTAAGKRDLTTAVLTVISQVENPVEKEHYLKKLSERVDTSLETLVDRMSQLVSTNQQRLKSIKNDDKEQAQITVVDQPKQDALLALMMAYPDLRDTARELSVDAFAEQHRQSLFRYMITHGEDVLLETVPPELQEYDIYVKIVQLKAEERQELSAQAAQDETKHLVGHIKAQHLKQKRLDITTRLRSAEASGDEVLAARLRAEFNGLIKEEHARKKEDR